MAKSPIRGVPPPADVKSVISIVPLLALTVPNVSPVGTPAGITAPQIWIDGEYVGGADQLGSIVNQSVEPNPDRGQCSMSETRRVA